MAHRLAGVLCGCGGFGGCARHLYPQAKTLMLINGESLEQISVFDRGFQYGDGVFETIAVINGEPLFWDSHLRRLSHAMKTLQLPDVKQRLVGLAGEAGTLTSDQFAAMNKADFDRFGKLVKEANVKME